MKHWHSDLEIKKKETLSNLAEKCAESIAKATESVAALESVLKEVKEQQTNFEGKALEAQIKMKEWIDAYNQPEFKDITWNTEEVIGLLKEFVVD